MSDEAIKKAQQKKAEAEAEKAAAEAAKARAEARAAKVAARKAALELAQETLEAESPAPPSRADELAARKTEAETRQAIAEAEKAEAAARADRYSAHLPDFAKIEKGQTAVAGDKPLRGSGLAHAALRKAAATIKAAVGLGASDAVLLTTDSDLASSDAVYLAVKTSCGHLRDAARSVLQRAAAHDREHDDKADAAEAGAVVAAIASALPGFLSLFSARRSLSSHEVKVDSQAAVAAVAGELLADSGGKPTVFIDDFRLVVDGEVVRWETELRAERARLTGRKLELEERKAQAEKAKGAADGRIASLAARIAQLEEDDAARAALEKERQTQIEESAGQTRRARRATVAIGLVDEVAKAIDTFLGALHTVPQGEKRSPFATAALQEQLHRSGGAAGKAKPVAFSKVIYLQAAAGSVDQLVNDRPLWFEDKFHSVATVSVTYWMVDAAEGRVVASGVATGNAEIHGTLGKNIKFSVFEDRSP